MSRRIFSITLAAVICLGLIGTSARATFHLWKVKEVFSNADGSVQFIELFDSSNNEQLVSGHQLKATSDAVTKTFTIPSNLGTSATANHHLLFTTPGFGSLSGGVTPIIRFPIRLDPGRSLRLALPTSRLIFQTWILLVLPAPACRKRAFVRSPTPTRLVPPIS